MQDATLRFYVLTSRNLKCLKRHFVSLPKKDTTVIINTLDKEYEAKAQDWCIREKINCVVTESNGMPGKGKNAVLDHFLDYDYDYMALIDGDDFLQPAGVKFYTEITQRNDSPDGIVIVHSKSYRGDFIPNRDLFAPLPWTEDFKRWAGKQTYSFPEKRPYLKKQWLNREKLQEQYDIHCLQNLRWNYPPDSAHHMDCARLFIWSRKLAKTIRFREDLIIGEDSLLNYEVRDLAFRKEITLEKVEDRIARSYFYDLTNSGIVRRLQNKVDWSWMQPLNEAVSEREPYWTVGETFSIPAAKLPEYLIDTPRLDLKDL